MPTFDINEIHKYLKKVDGWEVLKDGDKTILLKKTSNLKIL